MFLYPLVYLADTAWEGFFNSSNLYRTCFYLMVTLEVKESTNNGLEVDITLVLELCPLGQDLMSAAS